MISAELVHCRSNGDVIASYEFERDNLGRLIRSRQVAGDNGTIQRTEHIYDAIGRMSEQRWSVGSSNYSESYTYNDGENGNGALNTVTTATGDTILFAYDPLNRLDTTTVKDGETTLFTTNYDYMGADPNTRQDQNQTSNEIAFYRTQKADGELLTGNRYIYDALGNIIKIYNEHPSYSKGSRVLVSYTYDDQSQLTSETHYSYIGNGALNYTTTTWHYTYDTAGNILSRYKTTGGSSLTESAPTDIQTYTYSTGDWKDLLSSVTYGDTTHNLVYDAIGNPTTYGNGQQLYTNLTWEHGRQLSALTTNGEVYTFDYDADGIRIDKSGDGVSHEYITQNGKVVREHITSYNSWDWVLDFIYDNSGRPFALKYSNDGGSSFTTYYYVLNLQGDVVALLDANCNVVARYTYNAWGKLLSVTDNTGTAITSTYSVAHLNPLRYRGYYYDTETGFYYLQSRYYDPENCRFINADCYSSTGHGFLGFNMFSYCSNNPVKFSDSSGSTIEISIDATVEEREQYEKAVAYIKRSNTGRALVERLEKAEAVFVIVFVDDKKTKYDPHTQIINFDMDCGYVMLDGYSVQSAALALAHEMGHCAQYLDGELDVFIQADPMMKDTLMDLVEADNLTTYEIPIAKELGEPCRNHYLEAIGTQKMKSSTHFKTMVVLPTFWDKFKMWFRTLKWPGDRASEDHCI